MLGLGKCPRPADVVLELAVGGWGADGPREIQRCWARGDEEDPGPPGAPRDWSREVPCARGESRDRHRGSHGAGFVGTPHRATDDSGSEAYPCLLLATEGGVALGSTTHRRCHVSALPSSSLSLGNANSAAEGDRSCLEAPGRPKRGGRGLRADRAV